MKKWLEKKVGRRARLTFILASGFIFQNRNLKYISGETSAHSTHIPPISWGSLLVHILSRELGIQASWHIGRIKVGNERELGIFFGEWFLIKKRLLLLFVLLGNCCISILSRGNTSPLILQLVQGCLHCLVWSFIRLLIKIFPCTHMHCLIDRDVQCVFLTGPTLNLLSVG